MLAASYTNFGYDQWTFFLMRSGPTPIVLTIGLWVCFHNRFRRPLISRLIGAAIAVELVIYCVQACGPNALSWLLMHLRQAKAFSTSEEMMKWSGLVQFISTVIYNFLYAGIWGTALAGALYVERADTEQSS